MRSLTESPLAFAKAAYQTAKKSLPDYSPPSSPPKFTQGQLFAILAPKEFMAIDYRGIVTILAEWSELRQALELKSLPHYLTLCYAEQRLLKKALL